MKLPNSSSEIAPRLPLCPNRSFRGFFRRLIAFATLMALTGMGYSSATFAADKSIGGALDIFGDVVDTGAKLEKALDNKVVREKLDPVQTSKAWDWLLYSKKRESPLQKVGKILPIITRRKTETPTEDYAQIREIELARSQAEKRRKLGMSLAVYGKMCDELAVQLETMLQKHIAERKPHQEKIAVVLGAFKYTPYPGSPPDLKISDLLEDVVEALRAKKELQAQFAFLSYDADSAKELITKIGGNSDAWLSEDGRNHLDIDVKKFHPDDIYILSGKITEGFEDYKMSYEGNFKLSHPRTQGTQNGDIMKIKRELWFHPTRNFISLEDDAKLAAAVN